MGLGRFFRTQWRDRPGRTIGIGAIGVITASATAVTIATGGAAAPMFLMALLAIPAFGHDDKTTGNYITWDKDKRIVGDNRLLESIDKVSSHIIDSTREMAYLHDLPPSVERKLVRHLEDAQHCLKQVRIQNSSEGGEMPRCLTFKRLRLDDKGERQLVPFATVTDMDIILVGRVERLPVPAVTIAQETKALPAPAALTEDFSKLSVDVRQLQEKVAAIENPKATDLDKAFKK